MGLIERLVKRSRTKSQQEVVAVEVARELLSVLGEARSSDAIRKLACHAAVVVVAAQRVSKSADQFDPFFAEFWACFATTLSDAGLERAGGRLWSDLVEDAVVIVARGFDAVDTQSHVRFGRELGAFIDPQLNSSSIAVALAIAIEFGYHIVGATKLFRAIDDLS